MVLNGTDKQSILGPIIDEVGIISPDKKEQIISQLSAQIDRIINEKYSNITEEVLQFLKGCSSDILQLRNIVTSLQQEIVAMKPAPPVKPPSESIFTKHKEKVPIRKAEPVTPPAPKIEAPVTKVIPWNELKFSELVTIAKTKRVPITPRMKKEEIIELLKKGAEDGSK